MEKKVMLAVIGGFLGAGKTTAILGLAKLLTAQGKKIGIVTNDQGSSLVDTEFLKNHGLPVMEVAGGCFCCNFDEFTKMVNTLVRDELPDIILAEPVGSCTDLVATIFRPFQLRRADEFSLSPFMVIADPRRGLKLIRGANNFQNEINYLFQKQLEEADIILINKIDKYDKDDIKELKRYLKQKFAAAVECISAKDENTLLPLLPILMGEEAKQGDIMELDYEKYALAEDFLGWFNGTCSLSGNGDIRAFIEGFFYRVRRFVIGRHRDIAHLKIHIITSGGHAKASLTSVQDDVEYDENNFNYIGSAAIVINARINVEPKLLAPAIQDALIISAKETGLLVNEYEYDCFKPGRPDESARARANCEETKSCCCKKQS